MEIQSKWIRGEARLEGQAGSWTRERDMPLQDIVLCTLNKQGLSTEMEVRQLFKAKGKMEQKVSKQAYLQQRQKLNPKVFKVLNRNYLKRFYEGQEAKGWQGYLVLVVDGSRAEIPNSRENREEYGESTNQYGKGVARANISVLYDAYNRFMLNIVIDRYDGDEIEETREHISALKEIVGERPTVIVFDRLYTSLELINRLETAGIKYLMRVQKGVYNAELEQMEVQDGEVELIHTKTRMRNVKRRKPECLGELEGKESTKVRVVKTVFDNGEQVVFMTNLKEGSGEDIKQLYRERWKIEQKYHTLKNKMKFESVTGKASIYVKQDFWAQIVVFNMIQDLITAAQIPATENAKEKDYQYEVRINENIAIGLFKEQFICLILEEDDDRKGILFKQLITDMEKYIVPVRKLKSSPREWNTKNKNKCNQKYTF